MNNSETTQQGQPGIGRAALFGLCPRCGAKRLFVGLVQFTPRCGACDLDIAAFNVGDGAAAFLTMIVGAIVAVLAVTVQLNFEPPIWVHGLLWIPLTTVLVIWGLRMGKAALLAVEYQRKAGEGRRIDTVGPTEAETHISDTPDT